MTAFVEIRDATLDDVEVIADLGARFFDEAGWADVAEWDRNSIIATLRHMAEDPHSILLVAIRKGVIIGMAGGVVFPAYFNANLFMGQELFWWVDPADRDGAGRALFKAMEEAARDVGAEVWSMIALDKVRWQAVGACYKRRGYRASEHSFIKRLVA